MIKRFRLLVQHKGLLRKVYWVARRSDAIHAWCEAAPIPLLLGRTEYHYTYPADGNLHTSVRRYDQSRLVAVEQYYTDRVKVKTISATAGAQSKAVLQPPAEETMILRAAGYRPPPLAEYENHPHFFGFPTISIAEESNLTSLPLTSQVRQTDLVITLDSGRVSLTVSLRGRGYDVPFARDSERVTHLTDDSTYPHVALIAIWS